MNKYGLSVLHPAMVEINTLKERVAALESQLGRPFVVERGPWRVSVDGYSIESDDFTHDVTLKVVGDFIDCKQRYVYASEIARHLNNYINESKE